MENIDKMNLGEMLEFLLSPDGLKKTITTESIPEVNHSPDDDNVEIRFSNGRLIDITTTELLELTNCLLNDYKKSYAVLDMEDMVIAIDNLSKRVDNGFSNIHNNIMYIDEKLKKY